MTENRKKAGRFIPEDTAESFLTDSLRGVLKEDFDAEEAKKEKMQEKTMRSE